MRTDAFDFPLPADCIAAHPVKPRDRARLLEVGPPLVDRVVAELPRLLAPGDLLVFNDTRVIPARLTGRRGEARVEVTLHQLVAADTWRVFARPAKRLRPGETLVFTPDFSAEVVAKNEGGEVELRFDRGGAELMAALHRHGIMPLPPYIPRPQGPEASDREDYQTVFAARDGAVAAPTAGLHFTPELLAALEAHGVNRVALTLHVGAGTFLPVKSETVEGHHMHAEYGELSASAVTAIARTRAAGGRVVAVGTTSLRLLEAVAAAHGGTLQPFTGAINLFITPGFRFQVVDRLMTNFHLPRSTLFMLVSAFAGLQTMQAAYAHAVATGYRFYSYGDACLLRRADQEVASGS